MLAECQGGSGEGGGAMARVPGSWGHYRMLHTTQVTTLSSLSTHPLVFDLMIFVCVNTCNIPPVILRGDALQGRRGGCDEQGEDTVCSLCSVDWLTVRL